MFGSVRQMACFTPCRLYPGGQPTLGVFDDDAADRSQLAFGHKVAGLLDHGVAGVVVSEAEELAGLRDPALQVPGLLQVYGHGLVADHGEPGVQGGYGHRVVDVVGRDYGDEVHPVAVGEGGLPAEHLLVVAVYAVGGQQQVLAAEPGLLRRAAEGAADQLDLVVHVGGDAVDRADEGVPAASHHAHSEFSVHGILLACLYVVARFPLPPPQERTSRGSGRFIPRMVVRLGRLSTPSSGAAQRTAFLMT